jgi:plastocyanin
MSAHRVNLRRAILAPAFALVVTACGGASTRSSSPTSPTDGSATSSVTVTIANNVVSPQNVTVSRGARVTFVNSDNRPHDMESDPHPTHTDCPEINQVGTLSPEQSHQTGVLNTVRVCGFHDHEQSTTASLQGTIRIQ